MSNYTIIPAAPGEIVVETYGPTDDDVAISRHRVIAWRVEQDGNAEPICVDGSVRVSDPDIGVLIWRQGAERELLCVYRFDNNAVAVLGEAGTYAEAAGEHPRILTQIKAVLARQRGAA
jgi:hypothetical protein